jgi:hypothetical protein
MLGRLKEGVVNGASAGGGVVEEGRLTHDARMFESVGSLGRDGALSRMEEFVDMEN